MIGNPPYISVRTKSFDVSLKSVLRENYTLATGQYDLYTLFIEHAEKVLTNEGVLAFIIPMRMLSNENFMAARQFVMNKMPMIQYVNAQKPFESANVEANIMVCKKGIVKPAVSSEMLDNDTHIFKHVAKIPFDSILQMPFNIFPFVFTQKTLDVLFHIQANKNIKRLSEYLDITRGFECGYNDSRIGIGKYPFILSESISFYVINKSERLFCDPDFNNVSKYKNIETFCVTPKLLTKFCSNEIQFALDDVGYCNTNSVYNCALKPLAKRNLSFLLGLLNCKLTTFWFNTAFLNIDSIFPHIQKNQLESIPVPEATKTQQQPIIDLVDKILSAKKANPNADTSKWEKQIDVLVYDLYGLNEEEIRIIEG